MDIVAKSSFYFAAATLLSLEPSAFAARQSVDVELMQAHGTASAIVVQAPFDLIEPKAQSFGSGKYQFFISGQQLNMIRLTDTTPGARTGPVLFGAARCRLLGSHGQPVRIQTAGGLDREYLGSLKISDKSGKLSTINTVPVLDYVSSVVGSEMPAGFPAEALKAQAVLVQTIVARLNSTQVINDTTESQSYRGDAAARPEVRAAVAQVLGQTLSYQGSPIKVYFHSTCGGGTSDGARYFHLNHSFPYLGARQCTYCHDSPFWRSKVSVIPHARFNIISPSLPQVSLRDEAGRPLVVAIGKRCDNGYQFWMDVGQKLGWDKMPGTRYSLSALPDGSINLQSNGAGHGVGLCQWGAAGLAKKNRTYVEILRYYFPGTKVMQ